MIVRIWLIVGIALAALAWVLTVPLTPQPMQRSESSPVPGYRASGLLPRAGELVMSSHIGHDVFEIPAEDAQHTGDTGGMEMPGMDMGGSGEGMSMPGMNMGSGAAGGEGAESMPGMAMGSGGGSGEGMSMPGTSMESGAPAGKSGEAMPGMAMGSGGGSGGMAMPGTSMESGAPADKSGEAMPGMTMEGGSAPSMKDNPPTAMEGNGGMSGMEGMASGDMPKPGQGPSSAPMTMHADEGEAAHGGTMSGMEAGHGGDEEEEGGFGLEIVHGTGPVDRTVNLDMREWGFQPANLTVRTGEVIHFVVHNVGNIPHEFMFMPPQGMNAVRYRMQRADWNIKEHKALFEREVLLPGDSFEVTVRIQQPGMWMYMCMFPYHMRFGMMGMMMTEGMKMGGGDMKM